MSKSNASLYYPADQLQTARSQADALADNVIQGVFTQYNFQQYNEWISSIVRNDHALPEQLPKPLVSYFTATALLPDWANRRKMQQGAAFFARHAQPILSILGCYSLPYCYAAADGAQVLWLSQRIRHDARRRLAETAQFLLDVMDENAFSPRGKGIRSIQKVRLMHAAVRFHVNRSGQWNTAWGVPINQEDMAGTHLSFTYIVLDGLHKLGFYYDSGEAAAYLHLWNVIGWMLGIQESLLPPTMKEAYWLEKRIRERHFRPSEAGIGLTKALLDSMRQTIPASAADFLPAYMRHLLGDKVADMLAVPAGNAATIALGPLKVGNSIRGFFNQFSSSPASQVSDMLLRELEQSGGRTGFGVSGKLNS